MIRGPFRRGLAAALLLLLGTPLALAQPLRVPGEPVLEPKAAPQAQLRLAPAAVAAERPQVTLLPVTEDEVEAVRRANGAGEKGVRELERRRVVIGLARGAQAPRALPRAADLEWREVAGGHAAQLAVSSPQAGALRLALDLAGTPEQVEIVAFGSGSGRLEGPVRVGAIPDRTLPWWSPITEGETQTLELFVPAGIDPRALPLRVVDASHVFATPSSGFQKRTEDIGLAGSCNIDLPCSPLAATAAFQSIARSTAQMVFVDAGFTTMCTATLLADGNAATQTPWLYSANHCFENENPPFKTPAQMQQVANTLTTLWNFETRACGSTALSAAYVQVGGGAAHIYNNPQTDVLFLRMNAPPPGNAFFSGWDATAPATGSGVVAVHHPMGDLKKASQGSITGFESAGAGGGTASFTEVRWSSGTTERGSSGGGLWTSTGGQYFLRGGLYAGFASCENLAGEDYYSRLDQAYPQLAQYLGTMVGPALDYSDLWYNPQESGWGLNLLQHSTNVIFGVWYTYDAAGKRTWFTIPSGTWSNATTYSGPLFTAAGPAYDGAFDAAQVQPRQVGNATISFTSANTATFDYSVDGISGRKLMQRQPF